MCVPVPLCVCASVCVWWVCLTRNSPNTHLLAATWFKLQSGRNTELELKGVLGLHLQMYAAPSSSPAYCSVVRTTPWRPTDVVWPLLGPRNWTEATRTVVLFRYGDSSTGRTLTDADRLCKCSRRQRMLHNVVQVYILTHFVSERSETNKC